MTAAEKLEALGEQKGKREVAINLLKENVDPKFVAKVSALDLSEVLKLKAQLNDNV